MPRLPVALAGTPASAFTLPTGGLTRAAGRRSVTMQVRGDAEGDSWAVQARPRPEMGQTVLKSETESDGNENDEAVNAR